MYVFCAVGRGVFSAALLLLWLSILFMCCLGPEAVCRVFTLLWAGFLWGRAGQANASVTSCGCVFLDSRVSIVSE